MRIISGKAKGLKLISPPSKSSFLRPTSDRGREALFSILGQRVIDASILDLFAGTGAIGLEAVSRGASSAVFIDNNPTSISLIKRNITAYFHCTGNNNLSQKLSVVQYDLRKGLVSSNPLFTENKFDIIFLDPPYDKGLAIQTLKYLDNCEYLSEDGLIIVEERTKTIMPDNLASLKLKDKRKYGDTGFWMYSPRKESN